MLYVVCNRTSLVLILNNVLVYAHRTVWIVSAFLATVNNIAMNIHTQVLYGHIFRSVIASSYSNFVAPYTTFEGTAKLFYKAAPPFYIPTSNT